MLQSGAVSVWNVNASVTFIERSHC